MRHMATADARWMRGSSPLKGALLGLLLQRPGHGYDLANRLNRRLGPAWQIEAKSLYPMLQQLERASLVSSKRVAAHGPTGQRLVYFPTKRAADALTEWMATGAPAEPQRGELQAKLAVARAEDVPRLLAALEGHERHCLTLLGAYSEQLPQARSWIALAMNLTRAATLARLRAELDWIALARKEIAEFAVMRTKRAAAVARSTSARRGASRRNYRQARHSSGAPRRAT
jgi:DNA-binding PadR family transcriptional regulator